MDVCYRDNETGEEHIVSLTPDEYVVIDGGLEHKIIVYQETQIINIEMRYSAPIPPLYLSMKTLLENDKNFKSFFLAQKPLVVISDSHNLGEHLEWLIKFFTADQRDLNVSYRSSIVDFHLAALWSHIGNNYVEQNESLTLGTKYIRKAVSFLQKNYHRELTAKMIAEQSGVSQNYLNNLFREKFHMTINQYINYYRILKAKILIEKANLSTAKIAAEVGYRNKQNFNKNFLKFTNMTPREYRKLVRSRNYIHWIE
jgi:AraC-like DNA-binding protein